MGQQWGTQRRQLGHKKTWLWGVGLAGLTGVACSSGTQLTQLELAFLRPSNITAPDTLTVGQVENYVSFDLRRERDGVLITTPLAAYVQTLGADTEQETLRDQVGNLISPNRAVVLLGNGPVVDGTLQAPPTPYPSINTSPLEPYQPPTGWQGRATLAYTPGQTTIPLRAGDSRFGVYLASVLPFQARLNFATKDVQNVTVTTPQTYEFAAVDTETVTVNLEGVTGSQTEPIIVAICNQINAAILVGIQSGNVTEVNVPSLNTGVISALDAPTAYRTEAYRFNDAREAIAVSVNPDDPERIDVPLFSADKLDGTATLTFSTTVAEDQTTCFGDAVNDLSSIAPALFATGS
ncbi:MAG: hypothetical protein OHK0012_22600 [Synechococcales cyanobacterium]